MRLNRACTAQPGHKLFRRFRTGSRPVVLSSERYNGMVCRSKQEERQEQDQALEEEQRYRKYLQDGNAALMKCFTNLADTLGQDEDQVQANRDNALAERAKDTQAQWLLDRMRKERIMRADRIMNLLKPGPRALHQALLNSEMIYQQDYHQALKREFASEAERQQRLDEQQCPPFLVPFGHTTEQQEQALRQAKASEMRAYQVQDLEERRLRRLQERQQELNDCIVEREQYKCLREREERAAKERAQQKRDFCRRAYREALEEKAATAKYESMCDQIEDRIICVDRTTKRNLDARYNQQTRNLREKRTRALEKQAVELCREQQVAREKLQARQKEQEEFRCVEESMDECRRHCAIEDLSRQRRDYELKAQQRSEEQLKTAAEIRRFEMATRFKNAQANKKFVEAERQKKEAMTAELREVLHGQRKQFLQQRQDELMRITACDEDPYLTEDATFFEGAVQSMEECQQLGRPLFPLAKVVTSYRRDNHLDMVPEGQMVRRSKRRDKCWPGYFSKAELAYRKYEHRERCRSEQQEERHKIFDNCIKITKMAAEDRPYVPCKKEFPLKIIQHRGLPALSTVDSADVPGVVCWLEDRPVVKCPSVEKVETPPGDKPDNATCPSVMEVMKPGEEYPSSEPRDPYPSLIDAKSKSLVVQHSGDGDNSKRASGGKEWLKSAGGRNALEKPSTVRRRTTPRARITPSRRATSPDLTRYWTGKPRGQDQPKNASLNYPIISSIDVRRSCPKTNRKHFL